MTIIPQNDHDGQMLCTVIEKFFTSFHVGNLLRKCNASKEKGVPIMKVFRYIVSNDFNARSMYMQIRTDSYHEDFSKNTYYRFLNSTKTNWLRFTTLLSAAVVGDFMRRLTNENRSASHSTTAYTDSPCGYQCSVHQEYMCSHYSICT